MGMASLSTHILNTYPCLLCTYEVNANTCTPITFVRWRLAPLHGQSGSRSTWLGRTMSEIDRIIPDTADSRSHAHDEHRSVHPPIHCVLLDPLSPERFKILNHFSQSMLHVEILNIGKIFNVLLERKYQEERKRLSIQNDGVINEKWLYHGTSTTDSRLIYEGEVGFDVGYSNGGRWGFATYFASSGKYAHKYAHVTGDNSFVILLARVLTGHSFHSPPNSKFTIPPVRDGHKHYDSVTGSSHNSTIYMVYENYKAYPAYVITYKS